MQHCRQSRGGGVSGQPDRAASPDVVQANKPASVTGPVDEKPLSSRSRSHACNRREAKITKPHRNEHLEGAVEIKGTAECPDFSKYSLSFSPDGSPGQSTLIGEYYTPVHSGKLADWDTTTASDGDYSLTLSVFDSGGPEDSDSVDVRLDNAPPALSFTSPGPNGVVASPFEVIGTVTDAHLKSWKLAAQSLSPLLLTHLDNSTANERTGDEGRLTGDPTYQPARFSSGLHITQGQGLTYPRDHNMGKDQGTIEFWFLPDWAGDEASEHILFKTKTDDPEYPTNCLSLSKGPEGLLFSVYDSVGGVKSALIPTNADNLPASTPAHVAVTWDQGNLCLYLNGVQSTQIQGNGTGIVTELGRKLYVGFYPDAGLEADATFDELVIYDYARPVSAVRADCLAESAKTLADTRETIARGSDPVENALLGTAAVEDGPAEALSLSCEAKDDFHRESRASETVFTDNPAPVASIASPEEGAQVSGIVGITGTCYDMDLSSWSLSFKPGEASSPGDWTQIASGDQTVWRESIADWDTSSLSGLSSLRLVVTDFRGRTSQATRTVSVLSPGPLTADIISPSEGQAVDSPFQVTGTASGAGFEGYTLDYREKSPSFLCHFNDNTRNERDSDTGTTTGSPHFEQGKFASGLFIGAGDTLSYPTTGNLSAAAGTVEMWVTPPWSASDPNTRTLFFTEPTEFESGLAITREPGRLSFTVFDSYGRPKEVSIPVSDEDIQPGVPFHLGATWNEGDLRFYLNGVEHRPAGGQMGSGVIRWMGERLFVGSGSQGGTGAEAVMDELAIYPWVRDQASIAEDFLAQGQRTFNPEWETVASSSVPVSGGVLGTVESNALPGEGIELRLRAGASGQSAEDAVSAVRDSASPRAQITDPEEGGLVCGVKTVNGSASDIDLASYQLFYKAGTDPGSPQPWVPAAPQGTTPVFGGRLGDWDASGLSNGAYLLRLVVTDASGKTASADCAVEVNNDVPSALITQPASGGGAAESCEITGTASGPNFSSYSLSFKEGSDPDSPGAWVPIGQEHTSPVTDGLLGTWDTASLEEGPYLLRLKVQGTPGMEIVHTIAVFVDHTTPQAQIVSPEDQATVTGLVPVQGTAFDEHPDTYTLSYASESNPGEWSDACPPSSDPVTNGLLGHWNTEVLSDGDYLFRLTALDSAGHETTATISLSVENPAYTLASASVEPAGTCLAVGEHKQFLMVGTDTQGNLHRLGASWQNAEGLGSIDANGLFTATNLGHGFIAASSGTFNADVPVSVATRLTNTVLTQDTTLGPQGNPYVLGSWIVVPQGVTLTCEPGTVIKVKEGGFYVEGALEATGADKPTFTSYEDDSALGDTNADRQSSGSPGDWSAVYLAPGSPSALQGLKVQYGGEQTAQEIVGGRYVASSAAVVSDQAFLNVNNCEISSSKTAGLSSRFAESVTCEANTFSTTNQGYGVELVGARGLSMSSNTFDDCLAGALITCLDAPGGITITGNTFNQCHYGEATMVMQATDSQTNISNNTFQGTTSGGSWALMAFPGTNMTSVTGNRVSGYRLGILVGSRGTASVGGNYIDAPSGSENKGIHIGNQQGWVGGRAVCSGNTLTGDFEPAIGVSAESEPNGQTEYFENTEVSGNQVMGIEGTTGIEAVCEEYSGDLPASVDIHDNTISNHSEGIRASGFEEITITRNTVGGQVVPSNRTGIGISAPLGASSRATVNANTVNVAGGLWVSTGIEFSDNARGEIKENEVTGGDSSVKVISCSDVTLSANTLDSYSTTGIEFAQASATVRDQALTEGRQGILARDCPELLLQRTNISKTIFAGVNCSNSSLTAEECHFSGVSPYYASGIVGSGSSISVQQCEFNDMAGAITWSGDEAAVMGCKVNDCASGVFLTGSDIHVTANGNKMTGKEGNGAGLMLADFHGIAAGNTIKGFSVGISADSAHNYPQIKGGNWILDNGMGLTNTGPEYVDASSNWWGDTSGPAPYGDCNGISEFVDVQPWNGQSKYYAKVNGHDPHNFLCAEPVNIHTGNYVSTHTDLRIEGTGPTPEVKRTYNSLSPEYGEFGWGWSHPYSSHIEEFMPEYLPGDRTLVTDEGACKHYADNGDGTYSPEDEDYSLLVREPDESWTLKRKGGAYETFDPWGRITSITDEKANTLTVQRNSDGTLITDACGQTLTFSHNEDHLVSSVTDGAGRTVSYAYDEAGNLTEVHDLNGGVSSFTYDENHRILTVTDPKGTTFLHNEYDETGKVKKQTDAFGAVYWFHYRMAEHRNFTFAPQTYREMYYRDDSRLYKTGSANFLEQEDHFVYDEDGNLTSRTDRRGKTWLYAYDEAGNMTAETDPLGSTTAHTYDERGNCLSTTDPLGNVTTRTYDAQNNMLTETDPLDGITTCTYDPMGRMLTSTDPMGRATTNTYDERGNLLQALNPDGGITSSIYDAANRKTSEMDAEGHTTTYTYDTMGHVLTSTDPMGKTTTYGYDADGNRVSETDPNGNTSRTTYNSMGLVETEVDPLGGTKRYTYDECYTRIGETDEDGNTTQHSIDISGYECRTIDGRGNFTDMTHDEEGNLTGTTDRCGKTSSKTYDAAGRLLTETDPLSNTTTHHYDAAGNEVATTDPMGNQTYSEYDSAGRLVSSTDADGIMTTYEYDPCGNKVSETDAAGKTTNYAYDSMNRLISTTDPEGRTTSHAYDASGNKTSTTDGAGATTTFESDPCGRLSAVVDPLGNRTAYAYDDAGRKTSTTNARGFETTFAYDDAGRLTSETDPSGDSTTLTYSAAGRIETKTDGEGTSTFTYDGNGNMTNAAYPASQWYQNGLAETFDYDGENRSIWKSTPDNTVIYHYDDAGRLSEANNGYSYLDCDRDASGRITSKRLTFWQGGTQKDFTYTYSPAGRMEGATDENGTTTYAFDEAGRLISKSYPNGVDTSYGYDQSGALSALETANPTGTIKSYGVTRDSCARVTGVTEDGVNQTTYAYDAASRLTGENSPWTGGAAYSYDECGNRTSKTTDSGTTTYTYDSADRLTSDSQGNAYTYNGRGDLIQKSDGTSALQITRDGKGRAESIMTFEGINPGATSYFLYDAQDRVFMSMEFKPGDPQPTPLMHSYDMETDREVALFDYELNIDSLFFSGTDGLISATTAQGTSYLSYNPHSDLSLVTDTSATPVEQLHYDAWGNTAEQTDQPYTYLGKHQRPNYHDIGLIRMGARLYDPETGRFTSEDPLKGTDNLPITQNPYVYANDDPVNMDDLAGMVAVLGDGNPLKACVQEGNEMTGWSASGLAQATTSGALVDVSVSGGCIKADDDTWRPTKIRVTAAPNTGGFEFEVAWGSASVRVGTSSGSHPTKLYFSGQKESSDHRNVEIPIPPTVKIKNDQTWWVAGYVKYRSKISQRASWEYRLRGIAFSDNKCEAVTYAEYSAEIWEWTSHCYPHTGSITII
ncbi:MAG: right-handed parallel beta-helix repeat-containing protein [Actinomycetota bacterium]